METNLKITNTTFSYGYGLYGGSIYLAGGKIPNIINTTYYRFYPRNI